MPRRGRPSATMQATCCLRCCAWARCRKTTLIEFLGEQFHMPVLPPEQRPALDAVRETIAALGAPARWFVEHEVMVWREPDGRLHAAGPRLHDAAIQEAIEQWAGASPMLYLAKALTVEPILIALSGEHHRDAQTDPKRLAELAEEAPVIDFVNSVFAEAISRRASDVHFEPFEDKLIVRLRVDGVLSQRRVGGAEMFDAVASRLKLLSGMNIAERRLPQDGRQSIRVAGQEVDVRVSSLPTTWGESIVVRLLGATHRHSRAERTRARAAATHTASGSDQPTARPCAGHRPHRLRQDNYRVSPALASERWRAQDRDYRGPGGIRSAGRAANGRQRPISTSISPPGCARFCARTPTSSSSAKFAMRRRRKRPCRQHLPDTWSSRLCTRTQRSPPLRA